MSRLTEPVTPRDHVIGSADARVTLVEYGDYECPHCGHAHPIVQQVIKTLGAELRFVFRNFPLSEIHPHALNAAMAAEYAATQGKFWEMHDVIFENQRALTNHHLAEYGAAVGLSEDDLLVALSDESLLDIVQHDFSTGVRSGVNGTPGFFINGTRLDGPWDFDSLLEALMAA